MADKEPMQVQVAFDTLQAEDEPWLMSCFVPPDDFSRMVRDRSIAVFGRPGAGKSALCAILAQYARKSGRLVVPWQPVPDITGDLPDSHTAHVQQILDRCGMAILEYLAQQSEGSEFWTAMPTWVRRTLNWFAHAFVLGDLMVRVGPLLDEVEGLPGSGALKETLAMPLGGDLFPRHNVRIVVRELIKTLRRLGLEGLWVLVDPLAPAGENRADLVQAIHHFFSTLPFFEQEGFTYKWFLPAWSEQEVLQATGIERRRLDPLYLAWKPEKLRSIVEARLDLATGGDLSRIADLCDIPTLINWLEKVGGDLPREWLDQVRPLVEFYLDHPDKAPVDEKTWFKLRQDHPPRLLLDQQNQRVFVGGREIPLEEVSPQVYGLLKYLYNHAGRVVSRAELYYRVYLGQETIPRGPADEGYLSPPEYAGSIDTALWRLRRTIEPDPNNPVLLRTLRGHGVRLERRW